MKVSLSIKLLVVMFALIITSFVRDKYEEVIEVEFCNRGNIGICRPSFTGFRCYIKDINETGDCNGSRWVEL